MPTTVSICKCCLDDRNWKPEGSTKFQTCDYCNYLQHCYTQPKQELKSFGIVDCDGCSFGGGILGLRNISNSKPPKLDIHTHWSLSKEEVEKLIERLNEWLTTGTFKKD